MISKTIYTVGGTVQAGSGIYIKRKADDELLQYCRMGEFAFILASRQIGKSSLMVRTARQIEQEKIRTVIIDLNTIGVQISADEWYLGIISEISSRLRLKGNVFAWWMQHRDLGPAQRMTNFFREILLKEVLEPVVLFFDEIDNTLKIPFADDFFASLRAIYNARSTIEDFKRLSFVMIGVATPSELIADEKRTPFNIGHQVELTDFTLQEAAPLAGNLGQETLQWVFYWTSGHPYLTQRVFAYLSEYGQSEIEKAPITKEGVDNAIKELFQDEEGQYDNNLLFVRDMLTKRAPDIRPILKIYKEICLGKKVSDDHRSIPKSHLKISGVVRRNSNGQLLRRNRIYEQTFDLKWIKENTPPSTVRNLVTISSLITIIALVFATYFAWQDYRRTPPERAAQYVNGFQSAQNPATRLANLAGLFQLNDEKYASTAIQLFNGLSSQEQSSLFATHLPWWIAQKQRVVVKGLYQHMRNTEKENRLLETMAGVAPIFADEINPWLVGRKKLVDKDYYFAEANLEIAISKNPKNPALYYDRAQAYIGLGKDFFPQALSDLTTMVELDQNRAADAYHLINSKPYISYYWKINAKNVVYKVLAESITSPMVLISAGEFIMGSTVADLNQALKKCQPKANYQCSLSLFDEETPQHNAILDSFYIDIYEVTNARYAECVIAGVCKLPKNKDSSTHQHYYGDAEFDNYPVINVSWFDAKTYCQWRGARLPTEAEWEKAADWNDSTHTRSIYIGGKDFNGALLNFCDVNCPQEWSDQKYDDGYSDTSPVGNYVANYYGLYDMAGNVLEWVSDWYSETYYQISPLVNPAGPNSGEFRVLKGGSWNDLDVSTRATDRSLADPKGSYNQIGFRCARSIH